MPMPQRNISISEAGFANLLTTISGALNDMVDTHCKDAKSEDPALRESFNRLEAIAQDVYDLNHNIRITGPLAEYIFAPNHASNLLAVVEGIQLIQAEREDSMPEFATAIARYIATAAKKHGLANADEIAKAAGIEPQQKALSGIERMGLILEPVTRSPHI